MRGGWKRNRKPVVNFISSNKGRKGGTIKGGTELREVATEGFQGDSKDSSLGRLLREGKGK